MQCKEGLFLQLGHSPFVWQSCDCRQGQAMGTSGIEFIAITVSIIQGDLLMAVPEHLGVLIIEL